MCRDLDDRQVADQLLVLSRDWHDVRQTRLLLLQLLFGSLLWLVGRLLRRGLRCERRLWRRQ